HLQSLSSEQWTMAPVPAREESEKWSLAFVHKHRNPLFRGEEVQQFTNRLDRVFLHPVWGFLIFFAVMASLFTSIYWLATPLMDFVDGVFAGLGSWVAGLDEGKLWTSFLADGLIAALAAVFVFVPQIFILFVGIGLLESSGYLARAASLIDRPFSWLGMSGRSFVPVLSGFSCAVPALLAARNIPSARERWLTTFIIPLMTCSARLPVYALLLGFIFLDEPAWKAGVSLALLYFSALLVGAAVAAFANRILPERGGRTMLMMELPLYRRPRARVVLVQSLQRTWAYVRKAGPVIAVIAILMWAGSTFPDWKNEDPSAKVQNSYLARAGRFLEPLVEPMGGDWRVGVGLLSAFAAREVFVSTIAVVFSITDENEETQSEKLLEAMGSATNANGAPLFTTSSVIGLIIFFMIALQCMSTFAVARREMGSWNFAFLQLVAFNLLAWILATAVVQGLRALGVA
ncbi:MAG: ferrous iron transporter B, partial [Bdellovibrionaceae bacterium]|nr:ferrous iron transporter B [Pseudobdellovibrionaceae bacterium]